MIDFINKVMLHQQLNQNEVIDFIVKYCKLQKKPEPTAEQINKILFGIQNGLFDLNFMINQAMILMKEEPNTSLNILYDNRGSVVKVFLVEQ